MFLFLCPLADQQLLKRHCQVKKKRLDKLERYEHKRLDVKNLLDCARREFQESQAKHQEKTGELTHAQCQAIAELVHCIFPVEEVTPSGTSVFDL